MPAAVFDVLAPDYDAQFTRTLVGSLLRHATWRWLDRAFGAGQRVLELNCGTGDDALHLASRGVRVLATDASPAMVDIARGKVAAANAGLVEVRRLEIEHLEQLSGTWDGAFSNFGGLNCVADLHGAADAMARLVKPSGRVVLCVMGPVVPWEWVWFLGRLDARSAFRRLAPGGTTWRGITVRYPSVGATRRAFAPHFRLRRVGGLGVLVPPPYADGWARRHPELVQRLNRWERRIEAWPLVPRLGDHYLMELERR
jgi:SAM-dependent methyltransferase